MHCINFILELFFNAIHNPVFWDHDPQFSFSQHTALCLCASSYQKKGREREGKKEKFHIVFMLCAISFTYMCRHCKSVKISRCICSSTCTHCLSFLSFSLSYRFLKRPDSFKGRITERITILQWSHSLRNTKQKKKKKILWKQSITQIQNASKRENGKDEPKAFVMRRSGKWKRKKHADFSPKCLIRTHGRVCAACCY